MLKSNNISPPPAAKLYYTSFWDKLGGSSYILGCIPKHGKQFGMDSNLGNLSKTF